MPTITEVSSAFSASIPPVSGSDYTVVVAAAIIAAAILVISIVRA
jgi:hypothetical protein